MQKIATHLAMLGLDSSHSKAELKTAYRREMLKWHPDRFDRDPSMYSTATERAKRINEAFENLSERLEFGSVSGSSDPPSSPPPHEPYQTQHTYNRRPFTPGFPDADVFEVFVKSSHIVSAGYNRASKTLYIKFEGNSVYCYFDVPRSIFARFMLAESHGKFAHLHIYGKYRFARCKTED